LCRHRRKAIGYLQSELGIRINVDKRCKSTSQVSVGWHTRHAAATQSARDEHIRNAWRKWLKSMIVLPDILSNRRVLMFRAYTKINELGTTSISSRDTESFGEYCAHFEVLQSMTDTKCGEGSILVRMQDDADRQLERGLPEEACSLANDPGQVMVDGCRKQQA
jgi:hypothetical protein